MQYYYLVIIRTFIAQNILLRSPSYDRKKEYIVYHGTDYENALKIISNKFIYKRNKEHWLGNGIYFYYDISLAEWWTTNPTNKFGSIIKKPAIIKCTLVARENRILDLRNLDDYLWFAEKYKYEFISQVFHGKIKCKREEDGKFNINRLRCTFCDYLKHQYKIYAIIGTFDKPDQPYLPTEYGEGFKEFFLNYIETQICVFNSGIIKSMEIVE